MKGWKKICQANGIKEQAGAAVIISDKRDIKLKLIRRDERGHFILIKGTINQGDIIIMNVYTPNSGTLDFINTIL